MTSPRPYCNCRVKESCPLNGDCLQYSVREEDLEHYIGFTKNTFKDRLYKQKSSFKYGTKKNNTELSNQVWDKKRDKQEISFKWHMKVPKHIPLLQKEACYDQAKSSTFYFLRRNY